MPIGEFTRGEDDRISLSGGIMHDWQIALAREMDRPISLVITSRNRMDRVVRSGGADLKCFTSPEWMRAGDRALYDWTAPFMTVTDKLIGGRSKPLVKSLEDLRGVRIGTVLGYQYPTLQPLFEKGIATRDDAPSEETLLSKHLAGRMDYSVMRDINFRYRQKIQTGRLKDLVISPLLISMTPIHCARIKSGWVPLEALNTAQENLLKRGVLKTILARYLN